MQPGRNIAAGISSASQSIASGIEKYGAMRERDTIIRGKVEAVVGEKMKQGGADSWFNKQSEDTQRLLVKFQGGKESHDDLLKLGSYLDASETISQRDEAAKMQKLVYDTQMLNLQKAQGMAKDDEALRTATVAGYAAPGRTTTSEARSPISPEQANAEIGRYYSGESDIAPRPGVDISALTKYNAEKAMFDEVSRITPEQAVGAYNGTPEQRSAASRLFDFSSNAPTAENFKKYDGDIKKNVTDRAPLLQERRGLSDLIEKQAALTNAENLQTVARSEAERRSTPGRTEDWRQENPTEVAERQIRANSSLEELMRKRAAVNRSLGSLPSLVRPEAGAAPVITATPKALQTPAIPELSAITGSTTTSTPATSVEQFGASLKHLTEMGRATPKSIEALRDTFGIVDAKVQSVGGITLVTQGDKIIQAFQNKNANEDLKALTAEENKKLEAIQSSEGDIDRIEEALKTGNSGVIVGLIQKFWPWAVDSKKVEAMRNAAVPNLARGVFGEVGVLTETDVKRYIAMIPGLNSSPTQQATLIKELRTKLAATKLNSIQSLAAGNRDVSGWVSGMASPAASSGGGGKTYKRVNGQLIQQ